MGFFSTPVFRTATYRELWKGLRVCTGRIVFDDCIIRRGFFFVTQSRHGRFVLFLFLFSSRVRPVDVTYC